MNSTDSLGHRLKRTIMGQEFRHTDLDWLTKEVIGAFYEVSNTLGTGFLEKVYERALLVELGLRGLRAEGQVGLKVGYKGEEVGDYLMDVVVEDKLLVELKCTEGINGLHVAQCIHYLKASGRDVCLLVNFQRKPVQFRRIVFSHDEQENAFSLATD